jgi:predicted SAM-dependent methyltransferase
MEETQPLRLNIGGGELELDGYVNVDRKHGKEAYPLDYPENGVDEIRASHVLEHFPYAKVPEVLGHWVSRLKPGGRIRIAVPDFQWIAKQYLAGNPFPVQAFTMGSQDEDDNYHKAVFDREALTEAMINVGLERIGLWQSELTDCASLPVSLNMQAFKPTDDRQVCENTQAVLSCPRFGPMLHTRSTHNALAKAGVRYSVMTGAYWHQVLSEEMEKAVADSSVEFVFTVDYDSVFTYADVLELWRLARANTEADAICPLQCKRGGEDVLIGMDDVTGKARNKVYREEFSIHLTRIQRGHFGLTIFRADTLRQHPRPWMTPIPGADGRWGEDKVDCDINFWHRWHAAKRTLFLANRVIVGHLEDVVSWPKMGQKSMYQTTKDYIDNGIPAEVAR